MADRGLSRSAARSLRRSATIARCCESPASPTSAGRGESAGRIMRSFGDKPASKVTTSDVTPLPAVARCGGLHAAQRQQVPAGLAGDVRVRPPRRHVRPADNPVDGTDKRREPPPAGLDYYEVEEVEALARVCERGGHRGTSAVEPAEQEARAAEDRQDADAFRVLFYTGIRIGELLTLRWADVDLSSRSLMVRRTLSAGEETTPKGGRHRFVPLADPALQALARLGARSHFVGAEDYVVCNRWGRRLDASALRRRYRRACAAADLRPVKLHGLRHAAGSIVARTTDAVFVRDYLGHSKLSTTDRYVGAKHRPEDFERLNRAFASVARDDQVVAPVD